MKMIKSAYCINFYLIYYYCCWQHYFYKNYVPHALYFKNVISCFLPILFLNKHYHPHIMDEKTETRTMEKLNNSPKFTSPVGAPTKTQNQMCGTELQSLCFKELHSAEKTSNYS